MDYLTDAIMATTLLLLTTPLVVLLGWCAFAKKGASLPRGDDAELATDTRSKQQLHVCRVVAHPPVVPKRMLCRGKSPGSWAARMLQLSEKLGDCSRMADIGGRRITGRMRFCMIAYRPHFFLMVEEGTYSSGGNQFTRTGRKFAFSYVPASVVQGDRYGPEETRFREGAMDTSVSLNGYNPFTVSPSRILDSWKLADEFVALRRLKLTDWTFHTFQDQFCKYNVAMLIPLNGATDCIGYSRYHMCSVTKAKSQSLS